MENTKILQDGFRNAFLNPICQQMWEGACSRRGVSATHSLPDTLNSQIRPSYGPGAVLSFMSLPAIVRRLDTIFETVIAHYLSNTQVVVSKNLPTAC